MLVQRRKRGLEPVTEDAEGLALVGAVWDGDADRVVLADPGEGVEVIHYSGPAEDDGFGDAELLALVPDGVVLAKLAQGAVSAEDGHEWPWRLDDHIAGVLEELIGVLELGFGCRGLGEDGLGVLHVAVHGGAGYSIRIGLDQGGEVGGCLASADEGDAGVEHVEVELAECPPGEARLLDAELHEGGGVGCGAGCDGDNCFHRRARNFNFS